MYIFLIISVVIILGLAFKVALLNERLEGFREAQRQQQPTPNGPSANVEVGCFRILAIIGLVAICGLCFWLGLAASAGAR